MAKTTTNTSYLPPAYPPCTQPLSELEPITIAEMKLETRHRGKRVTLRVLTGPAREPVMAVVAIVEDEKGEALVLQLFFQPPEGVVPADEIVQSDDVVVLKQPFCKIAADGTYTLRVDHPGDFVKLENGDERIPRLWRREWLPMHGLSSGEIRGLGNNAVEEEQWAKAQRLYTSAIDAATTPGDRSAALLNRSYANLQLGRPAKALSDARAAAAVEGSSLTEKALFRKGRALYELGDFAGALVTLERLATFYPENAATRHELGRATMRLREQKTGRYSFRRMYAQAVRGDADPPLIDCATFSSRVEVRPSSAPGRGNGLFTTVPVAAGDLLLVEKAFGYGCAAAGGSEDTVASPGADSGALIDLANRKGVVGGQVRLLTHLIQKMCHDPKARELVYGLYHGEHEVPSVGDVDRQPVIDSFLVANIISLNAFGAPPTSRDALSRRINPDSQHDTPDTPTTTTASRFATSGLWLLASRINHSCYGNCRRSFIGDVQIVRAARDLPAGTELVFGYRAAQHNESHAEVQAALRGYWGFECGCELCGVRLATTGEMLARRKVLKKEKKRMDVDAALRILEEIEEATYPPASPDAEGVSIRIELWDAYFALGAEMLGRGEPTGCIRMIVRGLKALGFNVTATAAAATVSHWGYTTDLVPLAFLQLFTAYKTLTTPAGAAREPEACAAAAAAANAKKYAGVAYSILVGESETLNDEFPQFA
ncbi:hypothetical protein Micbo1qcDRAFT_218559 [Microdochium bolleyi]|uniref:SET domain-containing protein n=1 Tax=Microdochium bolleyi TaxID=196109 RepID=A0A136IPF2_9PEZI|nr:hypothetical protein Micbo1qcDRAFT_218559 [Microdochium bolleyi]